LKGECVDVSKELKIGNVNMNQSFCNNNFHKLFNIGKDRKSILDINYICMVLYTLLFIREILILGLPPSAFSLFTIGGFKFFQKKFKGNGLGVLNY